MQKRSCWVKKFKNNNSKQSENDDWNTLVLDISKYILHEASIYSELKQDMLIMLHIPLAVSTKEFIHFENNF